MSRASRWRPGLGAALDGYEPRSDDEARDLARIRALAVSGDPWTRSSTAPRHRLRGDRAPGDAACPPALATGRPRDATAETPTARLRWLSIAEAMSAVAEDNLRLSLARIGRLLGTPDWTDQTAPHGSR